MIYELLRSSNSRNSTNIRNPSFRTSFLMYFFCMIYELLRSSNSRNSTNIRNPSFRTSFSCLLGFQRRINKDLSLFILLYEPHIIQKGSVNATLLVKYHATMLSLYLVSVLRVQKIYPQHYIISHNA